MSHLLEVEDLRIAFGIRHPRPAVSGLSFTLGKGEIVALVGESGSGKSVSALAVMGLLPKPGGKVSGGRLLFEGRNLLDMTAHELRAVRGRGIGMIFQEPMTSLNPVLTVGRQMTEGLRHHLAITARQAEKTAVAWLERVGIADPSKQLARYPHEFSGGMRQRVMIAAAMALGPRILIADEPTTALDVTVQAQIMALMKSLVAETGAGLLLITHDMGVVAEIADKVVVMQGGCVVETADVDTLFATPSANYTRRLLAAVPTMSDPGRGALPQWSSVPALRLRGISKSFASGLLRTATVPVLDNLSIDLAKGSTLALVGESGSGKSTIGRIACRLLQPDTGEIEVDGDSITHLTGAALRRARTRVQMIFQDPFASLDPRMTIARTLMEPLIVQGTKAAFAREEAIRLLNLVRMPTDAGDRYPHQFSGGQRQRIAIARALAARPSVIVADEPTSALDVSIQHEILELLMHLQTTLGISYLFITHDLAVVRAVAHSVAVLRSGRIVEMGSAAAVLDDPRHRYTRTLLSAVPIPDPARRSDSKAEPSGVMTSGPLVSVSDGHWVAT